ncbi:putative TetR family transcriptional regulator [Gordonia terrae NBRC 100016]|nr:TetR family transcriptional regulator [Gordonia terrae]GAB46367.1 putative TetR family transcriptional regulator [Gordonia terrae NBRC 100016]VTR09555.1 HTH-type transcriptional regulator EthR [Clostridioides difficile]VTS29017.1 HTH-type transcriptional regulator EthR [Gordonia terrae]
MSKGERQRRAILESIQALLATRPIGELTVGEITAQARVGRSNFYFYFESKYTALTVLVSDVWAELMVRAESFVRFANEAPNEFLDRTAGTAVEIWRTHEAVLVASVQAIPLDAQLAEMWRDWSERLANVLTEQVLRDQQDGLARPASDDVSALVATLLEMTLHVFYRDRIDGNTSEQTERMLRQVRSIWLAAAWGQARNVY